MDDEGGAITCLSPIAVRSTVLFEPLPPKSRRSRGRPVRVSHRVSVDALPPARSPPEFGGSVSSSRTHGCLHLCNASRNSRRDDSAVLIDRRSDLQRPVVGGYCIQRNRRVPDLKHYVPTNDRLIDPDKWTCCRVAEDSAYLYGEQGRPTRLEFICSRGN